MLIVIVFNHLESCLSADRFHHKNFPCLLAGRIAVDMNLLKNFIAHFIDGCLKIKNSLKLK